MELTTPVLQQFFQLLDFSFQNYMKQVPSFYDQVATVMPSATEQNVYPFLAMYPGVKEWVGPRVVNNLASRSFVVVNKHWETTMGMDKNKFADDTFGFYSKGTEVAAIQIAEFRDRRVAAVIEAGVTTNCWDNQFFFDVDHPVDFDNAAAGVQANKLVGASYDFGTIAAPVADPLLPFAQARAAMAIWKRDADGQQMGTIGNLIMVHPNQEKQALQVANAMMTAQAVSSAAASVSNVYYGKVEVLVNPFLTTTTGNPWYLLATNRGIKPFLWQNRQDPQFVALSSPTDPNVFMQREIKWGWDFRGEASYTFPFLAFRMSLS
jgi:phage major head subunit gpT-like protein